METKNIKYPYLPEGRTILYVPISNPYMAEAKEYARLNSLDKSMPNASIIVKDNKIIGRGTNGSTYHDTHICERVKKNIPTGQGYELCEGCHPKNHGEPKAVKNAKDLGNDTDGADLYMWGHWWCCESCWSAMISAGIKNYYLLENSENLFNRESPDNIIGHQFE
ncbi:MAG TPA: deaminase [Candidatus Paceibacterota bacterium]|jgi:deoxycytidylate deaminase|nr:deaminase [Candidatus Paceibacterota bacterium]